MVLHNGAPVVEVTARGQSLVTFPPAADTDIWFKALRELVNIGKLKKLEISKINGIPIRETYWPPRFEAAGFTSGYRGMLYRP